MVAPQPIVIIGGGPAGLMAAEVLAGAGHIVHVYDRKPSLARKFLMAGRGGLNITHSEPLDAFLKRYGAAEGFLSPLIQQFTPDDLRAWCEDLGQETFVGSSGRVFPKAMKASPLLRAWIARLESQGVQFHLNRTWTDWNDDGALSFIDSQGNRETVRASALLLALGGASWPALGSDGAWVNILRDVPMTPLRPANCGFHAAWSDVFKDKFSGTPLKNIALRCGDTSVTGEIMIARNGIEGGAVYALSATIRGMIEAHGLCTITIDLKPHQSTDDLATKFEKHPAGRQSFSSYMKKAAGLPPVAINLLREANRDAAKLPPRELAALIRAVPVTLHAPFDIGRAISSAGGIKLDAVDSHMMLNNRAGVFVAGEMLDWEAPTGGYLLQACFATGAAAGRGIKARLVSNPL